jgi:hypothetical protein
LVPYVVPYVPLDVPFVPSAASTVPSVPSALPVKRDVPSIVLFVGPYVLAVTSFSFSAGRRDVFSTVQALSPARAGTLAGFYALQLSAALPRLSLARASSAALQLSLSLPAGFPAWLPFYAPAGLPAGLSFWHTCPWLPLGIPPALMATPVGPPGIRVGSITCCLRILQTPP